MVKKVRSKKKRPSTLRKERDAFKELVRKFFEPPAPPPVDFGAPKKILEKHLTVPNLAEFLAKDPDEIIYWPIDDHRYPIVAHAVLRCQNYIVNGMLNGKIDRTIGQMLLEQYHGFKKRVDVKHHKGKSISDILDGIEEE